MKTLAFIYNPTAGTGKVRAHLGEIADCFARHGYEVTLHPTTGPGDATQYIRDRAGDFDRLVCAGGDGTLSEAVSGLLLAENPAPMGYIPTGTTNDFAKTLEIPTEISQAAECAAVGLPQAVDVGIFNGRPFVYIAAFGLFSDVSYSTPQKMKNSLGHLAYVLSGIPQLANITPYPMEVTCDGQTVQGEFIYGMVSDTVTVGGVLDLDRDEVRINDGRLEVFLVRAPKNLPELNGLIYALMNHQPCESIVAFQGNHITFRSSIPVPWTLDGEYGGTVNDAEVFVLNQAVSLVTKPDVQALSGI